MVAPRRVGAGLVLVQYDRWHDGHLRIRVHPTPLTVAYVPIANPAHRPGTPDQMTVDLATRRILRATPERPAPRQRPNRPG